MSTDKTNAARTKELNDTIRYTMWSVFKLRDVLGDDRYESLARIGADMTNAARANYALDQIDLARAAHT